MRSSEHVSPIATNASSALVITVGKSGIRKLQASLSHCRSAAHGGTHLPPALADLNTASASKEPESNDLMRLIRDWRKVESCVCRPASHCPSDSHLVVNPLAVVSELLLRGLAGLCKSSSRKRFAQASVSLGIDVDVCQRPIKLRVVLSVRH